jgi:hypothetical protein
MLVKHFFNEFRQAGGAIDLGGLDGLINSDSNWSCERTLVRGLSTVHFRSRVNT